MYIPASSKGCCLNLKGWFIGTPYHPLSTPWKIQVYIYIFIYLFYLLVMQNELFQTANFIEIHGLSKKHPEHRLVKGPGPR